MTSKKTARDKQTAFPLTPDYTKGFRKDWDALSKSGRYDMKNLKNVMLLLIANDGPLDPKWKDHNLVGNWIGYRECHIGGDFLLIYKLSDNNIIFVRCGTHSQLFR